MISTPLTRTNCPVVWAEHEAKDEQRRLRDERVERFQPAVIIENRPDIELSNSRDLGQFAKELIDQKRWWMARAEGNGEYRDQLLDTEEIRRFAMMAATAIEPVIIAVFGSGGST